jgi:two-component system response regulator AtoC
MRTVERVLAEIAPMDISVLLLGESGTGKDMLAHSLHRQSRRSTEPFVKMSCAALTPSSLREILNSPANGNGSGALRGSAGTLFLDDICELELACQTRLLSALPDEAPAALEADAPALSARLVCATSRNLDEQLRTGRFREELYFRMNGVCLRIPPLRQRRKDIPRFLGLFVEKFALQLGHPRPALSPRTVQAALEHPWPGNLRQLESFARQIVLLGDERAVVTELEGGREAVQLRKENGTGISLKEAGRAASRQAERELILKTLARTRWNRKRAAQELRISYKALLYKLKDIGMDESLDSNSGKEL